MSFGVTPAITPVTSLSTAHAALFPTLSNIPYIWALNSYRPPPFFSFSSASVPTLPITSKPSDPLTSLWEYSYIACLFIYIKELNNSVQSSMLPCRCIHGAFNSFDKGSHYCRNYSCVFCFMEIFKKVLSRNLCVWSPVFPIYLFRIKNSTCIFFIKMPMKANLENVDQFYCSLSGDNIRSLV